MNNRQLEYLDLITILSFSIGLENLQENRQQSENQEKIIKSIEEHLKKQDEQYEKIIKLLERS